LTNPLNLNMVNWVLTLEELSGAFETWVAGVTL
jgi:hypothetical protein